MTAWKINDEIYCQQLTSEYLEEALNFIENVFYPNENVSRTLRISNDPKSLLELRELTRTTAKDGITIIALDAKSNQIVGAAFNKLQVKDNPVFENFAKNWKHDGSQSLVEFMAYFDNLCNLFDYCGVDCIFELMFLATSPKYAKRGIGKKLTEISIEVACQLAKGNSIRKSIDDTELALEPKPKILSAIFSSFITQKIGRQLNFEIAISKRLDDLNFKGLNFDEVIKSGTKEITLEYKRL